MSITNKHHIMSFTNKHHSMIITNNNQHIEIIIHQQISTHVYFMPGARGASAANCDSNSNALACAPTPSSPPLLPFSAAASPPLRDPALEDRDGVGDEEVMALLVPRGLARVASEGRRVADTETGEEEEEEEEETEGRGVVAEGVFVATMASCCSKWGSNNTTWWVQIVNVLHRSTSALQSVVRTMRTMSCRGTICQKKQLHCDRS